MVRTQKCITGTETFPITKLDGWYLFMCIIRHIYIIYATKQLLTANAFHRIHKQILKR